MNLPILLLSLALALPDSKDSSADAALASVPPPANFYIPRVPPNLDWLVVVTPHGKGPAAPSSNPALPTKYLLAQLWSRAGGGLTCVSEWTDGTKTHDKIEDGTKFFESPQDHGVHVFNPKLDPRYHDFNAGDFELLDWMTPSDYVGAFMHDGTACYLYRSKTSASGPVETASAEDRHLSTAALHAPASPTSVYISIASRLPLAIDNADGEYLFAYGAPGKLQLPSPAPVAEEPPPPKKPASHHKPTHHHTKPASKASSSPST